MPLRKALIRSVALQDNAGSFTNVTNKRLHIRKLDLTMQVSATFVAGDEARMSVDEVPAAQDGVNDTRSHIAGLSFMMGDSTGAGLKPTYEGSKILSFNRNDLVLDPDEAIFLNTVDETGAPTLVSKVNVWYED